MKILYINDEHTSAGDSGTFYNYYLLKGFRENGVEIEEFNYFHSPNKIFYKIKEIIINQFSKKRHTLHREPGIYKSKCRAINREITAKDYDAVLTHGSLLTTYLETNKPVAFYTDAVFAALVESYPYYRDLNELTKRNGHFLEKLGLKNSDLYIFATPWAADAAINHYNAHEGKILIAPMGPLFEHDFTDNQLIEIAGKKAQSEGLNFVIIGTEWERKGGDIFVETLNIIKDKGIDVKGHFIGFKEFPMKNIGFEYQNHGYIKKSTSDGKKLFLNIMNECHFLFVPSRGEAQGQVFPEANMLAVPSISYAIGGIPFVLKDKINGILEPAGSKPADFANRIIFYHKNREDYLKLCNSSLEYFNVNLSWKASAKKIIERMKELT